MLAIVWRPSSALFSSTTRWNVPRPTLTLHGHSLYVTEQIALTTHVPVITTHATSPVHFRTRLVRERRRIGGLYRTEAVLRQMLNKRGSAVRFLHAHASVGMPPTVVCVMSG